LAVAAEINLFLGFTATTFVHYMSFVIFSLFNLKKHEKDYQSVLVVLDLRLSTSGPDCRRIS